MLKDALSEFSDNIFNFLTGENNPPRCLLLKKHCDNLSSHGEYSFVNTTKAWQEWYGDLPLFDDPTVTLLKCIGRQAEDIAGNSKKWTLQVTKVKEERDRVYVYIERPAAIQVGLKDAINNISYITQNISVGGNSVTIDPLCTKTNCLASLRVKYLGETIQNLISLNLKSVEEEVVPKIFVTSKSTSKCKESRIVLVGTVLNATTGNKESSIDANEFIRIRQKEMTLIAQHKYGVRVSTDIKWKEFIDHLGESAVIFELLQTKPSGAVKINFDCASSGSSKGASFILYNCARLETLVKTYNEKVNDGEYPPLPHIDDIDFSLLSNEDEWSLVFNYILGLPTLLNSCVDIRERVCDFRPQLLCNYLCSMVRLISQYYRKVRILTEPRKHLLPVLYARMYMVKILNDTLKTCLKLLNIKSVSQM